jgi:PAS domain-containing protein
MMASDDLSANAYELLVQGVVDYAIYLLDPKGHVVSWNPGAERIKGYTADEVIGTHFSRFYADEDRAAGAPENALKVAAETGRFTIWLAYRLHSLKGTMKSPAGTPGCCERPAQQRLPPIAHTT